MDTSNDVDHYELTLKKDEIVQITVDALEVDPELTLSYRSSSLEEVVRDDDSGGGIFGSNAQLTYKAPADDTYTLVVRNYDYGSVGSYFLTVAEAEVDAELTEPAVTRELFSTGYGPMTWFKSEEHNFAVLYPTVWTEVEGSRCAAGATACYTGPGVIILTEEALAALPKKERNREGYLTLLQDNIKLNPAVDLEEVKEIATLQKLTADQLSFTTQAGRATGKRFIYVDEEQQVAFSVTIVLPTEAYAVYEPMITFIFESFRNWNTKEQDRDAVYHLDRAYRLTATKDYEGARTAYDRSIELDAKLVQSYAGRAWINYRLDADEQAIADLEQAIQLAPEDDRYYGNSAMLYWNLEQHDEALRAIDKAIALVPEQGHYYNQRALIKTFLGDYEGALADLAEYQALNDDELPPSALDTRAFVYLMMADFAKAQADYEEAYSKDFRSPYTLLGGGIVYANLGDEEQAQALLEEGFKKLEELEVDLPDPQLSELTARARTILDEQ